MAGSKHSTIQLSRAILLIPLKVLLSLLISSITQGEKFYRLPALYA